MKILMYFFNSFILDFKGIYFNLIETNYFKFHELLESLYKMHKEGTKILLTKVIKTIIINISLYKDVNIKLYRI